MCRPDDYPPYPTAQVRLYDVEYYVDDPHLSTQRQRLWAHDPDEARVKAKSIDPRFIATSKTPRIIR